MLALNLSGSYPGEPRKEQLAPLSLTTYYKYFNYIFQPPVYQGEADCEPPGIKAVVEEAGFITLHLEHGMAVFVAPNQAVLVIFIDAPIFKIHGLKTCLSLQVQYSGDAKTRLFAAILFFNIQNPTFKLY